MLHSNPSRPPWGQIPICQQTPGAVYVLVICAYLPKMKLKFKLGTKQTTALLRIFIALYSTQMYLKLVSFQYFLLLICICVSVCACP